MAIRDKMVANAQGFLEPGEAVQAVFGAQTFSQYWALVTYWMLLFKNQYRVVVVSDRRIMVCRSGKFTTTTVNEVLATMPRATRIGPASGLWWKCESLGEKLYVHKRFHKDVAQADAIAGY